MRESSSQRWLAYWVKPELPRMCLCWLITPEEPDETQAQEEDSRVSGCFHGLLRHLNYMVQVLVACWREGRTVASFYLGHSHKIGASFPHLCPAGHPVKHQLLAVSALSHLASQ